MILIIYSSTLLHIWLGHEFAYQSTLVFQILLIGAFFALLAPVPGSLIQGLGRPDLVSKLYLLYFPLNVVLVWLFVRNFGIVGAALSYAIRAMIETTALFIISSRMINLTYHAFLENCFARTFAFTLAYTGLLWVVSLLEVSFLRICLIIILVLLFIITAWMYILDDVDKRIIIFKDES
jgi:O-antigen/teichoic acid export membrane protein